MVRRLAMAGLLLMQPLALAEAWSAAIDDLYQARAIVTGQGEVERARGFALCLEDVLVKLSGDPHLIGDPRLAPLEATAARLVGDFTYHDRMSGLPLHDEQGTRDRPYDLTVTFDRPKIDAALRSLGLEPWTTARPRLVIVLGIHDATTAYVLAQDGERGLGQRESLRAASLKRGMPMVIPDSAALAAEGLTYDTVPTSEWPRLDTLAKRAGGDIPLAGTLVWDEPALGWVADWRLNWQGRAHHWRLSGVSFDDAFRSAMAGAAEIISGHGEPP